MILCILTCKHNRLTYYYKQITLTINKTFISLGFLFLQDINYRSLFLFLNNLSSSFFFIVLWVQNNSKCSLYSMISWVLFNEWVWEERKRNYPALMKYMVDVRAKTWPCLCPIDSDRFMHTLYANLSNK